MSITKRPLLSICIPTYKREEILKRTIESIYGELKGVDLNDFEVVISDNDPEQSCSKVSKSFTYSNLYYYPTSCEGFLNSFYALGYGRGEYLKLHNNQVTFKRGSLKLMIDCVQKYKESHTMFFFTNGNLLHNEVRGCSTFDMFMEDLSYFCSWSSGYGMWKDDFDRVKNVVSLDNYFPQTSLLLSQNYHMHYVVDDRVIFGGQKVTKKGGYNTYKVFGTLFLDLIMASFQRNDISISTFKKIKKELLYDFLAPSFFKTVIAHYDSFEHTNVMLHLSKHYSKTEYYKMVAYSFFTPFTHLRKKIRKNKWGKTQSHS